MESRFGAEARSIPPQKGIIRALALAGPGRVLSAIDNAIRLWDLDSGAELQTLTVMRARSPPWLRRGMGGAQFRHPRIELSGSGIWRRENK